MEEKTPYTGTHYNWCFERRMTMIPGYHDHEKFVQAHRQNLLREAEHERLLAQVPQPDPSFLRHFLARPALLLRSLRARLEERAKRRKQQINNRAAQ
jgi:hypothetical protein